jgi:hypothetical protein
MATPQEFQRIQDQAYRIWEQEGRPHGRDSANWEEAERQLREPDAPPSEATLAEGLEPDAYSRGEGDAGDGAHQDTPGRAKSASSRQQTQPDQSLQSGSEELDRRSSRQSSGVENR